MTRMILAIFFFVLTTSRALADQTDVVLSVSSNETTSDGIHYNNILSKLGCLEYRFSELLIQLKEQGEDFLNNQRRIETDQQELKRIIDRHERKIVNLVEDMEYAFGSNVSQVMNQSLQILELQTICSNHDLIRNELMKLRSKNSCVVQTVKVNESPEQVSEIPEQEKNVYQEVHKSFGGNWLIILQRSDGSENFNRNWSDYQNGFGTPGKEFWLGLERMYQLTKNTPHELLVDMEDFAGHYEYARYDKFEVGPEADLYQLKELGTYSGTAGDALGPHRLGKFSTVDNGPRKDCTSYNGGWWYYVKGPNICYNSHLTGNWQTTAGGYCICWYGFNGVVGSGASALKSVKMMIRKL